MAETAIAPASAPAATPPPATPAPSTPAAAPAPEATPPAPEAAKAETFDWGAWEAALEREDVPWDNLLKARPINSRIGTHADRLATERADALVAQRLADADHARREAELDRIAEQDPEHPLAKVRLDAKQETQANAATIDTAKAMHRGGIEQFVASLPAPVRAEVEKLKGKEYAGDYFSGQAAFMKDVLDAYVATQRTQWEKEERPALEKEALSRLNGGEAPLDREAGTATGGGLTIESYRAMSAAERRKLSPSQVDELTRRASAA